MAAFRGALVDARLRVFNLVHQRVKYFNTYALSILWHTASVILLTKESTKEITKATNRFLWAGSLLKVPHAVLVQPPERGGLGLHDVELRAHALFISRWTASTTTATFAGRWLAQLRLQLPAGKRLSKKLDYYRKVRDEHLEGMPPSAKCRAREIYSRALERDHQPPRAVIRRPQTDWSGPASPATS